MLKDRSLLIKVTSEQKGGGRLLIQESILKQSAFCRAEAQSCGYKRGTTVCFMQTALGPLNAD